MALISVIENFHPKNDTALLARAAELTPVLHRRVAEPVRASVLSAGQDGFLQAGEEISLSALSSHPLSRGEGVVLDFGDHLVGQVQLNLGSLGSHPDAPAWIELTFAENIHELAEDPADFHGWISSSWIPTERLHVDELPAVVSLPRRYAFRFLRLVVLDTSPKYRLTVRGVEALAQTSADRSRVGDWRPADARMRRIYEVSLRTLEECMQEEFEDGPRRDKRLWMGDLRLQALTNYISFDNADLVRRCLYLFAGTRFPDGRVSACVFTRPEPAADDTWLFDYALFFVVALEEYLEHTGEEQTLEDLYGVAMDQVECSLRLIDHETGLLDEPAVQGTFIDWNETLDKHGCANAVLLYAMDYAVRLARRAGDKQRAKALSERRERLLETVRAAFWDERQGLFASGGQVSVATQVWMVLAGVTSGQEAREVMERSEKYLFAVTMDTPYMHHFYAEALVQAGLVERALEHLDAYWGSMIDYGADTFFEAWNPENPGASPYGGSIVNSFCHAWSCTPAYILYRLQGPGA